MASALRCELFRADDATAQIGPRRLEAASGLWRVLLAGRMLGVVSARWVVGLVAVVLFGAGACACSDPAVRDGEGTGGGGTGGGGTGSSDLTGAWYGMGNDGDHCFVLCANGRFFTGDRPCTELDATDFDTYLTYTASGITVELETPSPACWLADSPCAGSTMSLWVTGDDATIDWCGYTFTMSRSAASSPLCDDPARQPC